MQLQSLGTRSNKLAPNREDISLSASWAPLKTSFAVLFSSESSSCCFSLSSFAVGAVPRAGSYSRVRIPASEDLAAAKMGVRVTSWQRNVQRFLTSLSEGFARRVDEGEEQ